MKPTLTTTQKIALTATISASVGSLGGAIINDFNTEELLRTEQIIQLQEAEKDKSEEYQQYLKAGELPEEDKLEKNKITLPENVHVNVYDGPRGKGYVIVEDLPDRVVTLGFGPDADSYTSIEMKGSISATSSPK